MKNTNNKTIIIVIIAVIIMATTIGIYLFKANEENSVVYDENNVEENSNANSEFGDEDGTAIENIAVYVIGEVNYKGVVVLKQGARIVDAIDAAGGESENADLSKLNLAYVLSDGEKIVVPNKNDNQNETTAYVTKESGGGSTMSEEKNTININTATKEELMKLSGVGEAIANRIIAYRSENGKFKQIEDLKNVPGIGDSKFNNIKDSITVK